MNNAQGVLDYSVNKTFDKIAYRGFCTVFISGSFASTVGSRRLNIGQHLICENNLNNDCTVSSALAGINYAIQGYTLNNITTCVEKLSMNNEKINNLEKLEKIAKLENGWDGENAKAFDSKLIQRVRNIIMHLDNQPEIFPTACDTIQIEYDRDDGSYLEIEISDSDEASLFSIDSSGVETSSVIEPIPQTINKAVSYFYG